MSNGFPCTTNTGETIFIVEKQHDDGGFDIFIDADGGAWTNRLSEGGNDAHTLYPIGTPEDTVALGGEDEPPTVTDALADLVTAEQEKLTAQYAAEQNSLSTPGQPTEPQLTELPTGDDAGAATTGESVVEDAAPAAA